jgi:hypothetical protein
MFHSNQQTRGSAFLQCTVGYRASSFQYEDCASLSMQKYVVLLQILFVEIHIKNCTSARVITNHLDIGDPEKLANIFNI